MALKPRIYKLVSLENIQLKCAAEFTELINVKALNNSLYTVIAYPGMKGESQSIVDSKSIEKALSKVSVETENVVAIAHNFTAEATKILESHKIIFFSKSNFYWTDSSWANIRDTK
jgi:hypothetical protein